jgi:hypothetical protein
LHHQAVRFRTSEIPQTHKLKHARSHVGSCY